MQFDPGMEYRPDWGEGRIIFIISLMITIICLSILQYVSFFYLTPIYCPYLTFILVFISGIWIRQITKEMLP